MTEFTKRLASKLVRDKIPGNRTVWPDRAEHYTLLVAKLSEEAAEVARSHDDGELLSELADVIEVALTLGVLRGLTVETIDAYRMQKHHEKGGFLRGVVQDGIIE
jgi:predicted house-cleaning noncanonical NTP pyrophosphatase (MazG superfamily)